MKSMIDQIKEIQQKQAEQDEVQAEILLNQATIQTKLAELDEVQAEILLQGLNV